MVVSVVCTWFYVNSNPLSCFTEKALQLSLTDKIMAVIPQAKRMTGNIRPTDMAAVLAPNKQGDMAVFPMVWGFTHEAASRPIINCRMETADQKVLWRDSWFRRRCIIPASWYFEWGIPPSEVDFHNTNEHNSIKKEKYAIQPDGTDTTYLASLYRFEDHHGVQVNWIHPDCKEILGFSCLLRQIHNKKY